MGWQSHARYGCDGCYHIGRMLDVERAKVKAHEDRLTRSGWEHRPKAMEPWVPPVNRVAADLRARLHKAEAEIARLNQLIDDEAKGPNMPYGGM